MNYNTASYFNPQQQDETSFFATKKQHLMENPLSYATKVECPNGGNKTTNFIGGSTNNNNGGQLSPGFNLATSFQIQANSAQPNCLPFFSEKDRHCSLLYTNNNSCQPTSQQNQQCPFSSSSRNPSKTDLHQQLPSVQQMASAIVKLENGPSTLQSSIIGNGAANGSLGNGFRIFSSAGNIAAAATSSSLGGNADALNQAYQQAYYNWTMNPAAASDWELAAVNGTLGMMDPSASVAGNGGLINCNNINNNSSSNYNSNSANYYMTNAYLHGYPLNYCNGLRNASSYFVPPSQYHPYPTSVVDYQQNPMFNNTMAAVTPYQTVASTVATSLGQAASAAVVPPSSSNNNNNNNNNSRNGACNQQPPRYRETASSKGASESTRKKQQFDLSPAAICSSDSRVSETQIASEARASSSHNSFPIAPSGKITKPKSEKKRSKKKKPSANKSAASMYTSNNNTGCLRGGPAGTLGGELENETQVFVWELDDLCSITTPDRHTVESYINCVIGQIFQLEFQIDTLEELDHANIEDASLDEAMQDVASANSGVLASNNRGEDFCCGDTSAAVLPNLMTDNNNDLGDQKTRLFPMEGTSSSAETVTIGSPTLAAKLEGLRRIASKYAHIRRVYDKYRGNDKGRFEILKNVTAYINECDKSADSLCYPNDQKCGPVERYQRCLKHISQKNSTIEFRCTNVVIASEPVASALAKLMIFNHAAFVPAENVYSVGKIGKDAVLERILNRFHRKRVIIVSSNAPETGQLAYREGRIPFWHIRSLYDIDKFWLALEYVLLVNVNDEEGRQHEHQQNSQQSQINLYAENSIIEPKPASGISKMI